MIPTKAQRVRAYQVGRIKARMQKRSLPRFDKYSPDQPRDDHGRWTSGGGGGYQPNVGLSGEIPGTGVHVSTNVVGWKALTAVAGVALATALIRNPAMITQALRMVRNPGELRAAWTAFTGGAAARMREGFMRTRAAGTKPRPPPPKPMGAKPPLGGTPTKPPPAKPAVKPAAKPAAASTVTTKPFSELGRRQQLRRENIVRNNAMARGATPAQADNLVGQMRAAAGSPSGLAQARPGATITTPQAVALEQSRIASEVARHQAALIEYNALAAKGASVSQQEYNRRIYLYNQMESLERSIAAREKALGRPQGFKFPKPPAAKKRLTKAVTTGIETAAGIEAAPRVGAATPRPSSGIPNFSSMRSDTFKPATSTTTPATGSPRSLAPQSEERNPTGFGSITYKLHGGRSTTILKYREDQRRDDEGRFADEGKGGVASFTRHTAGLGNIGTEAQARAYTARTNEQLAAMQRLPSSTWRDPTVLDKAWDAYTKVIGAVALAGIVLAGGVKIMGTPNAVAIYYGLLGVKVTGKRLVSTLATARNLLMQFARNKKAVNYGFWSLVAAGAAASFTPGRSAAVLSTAVSWNQAALSGLANTPKTAAIARALLTQVSLPRLFTAGKVAAATGALLATAQGLRYGYRMIQSNGEYRGTDETNRRLETIEQHILALRRLEHGRH